MELAEDVTEMVRNDNDDPRETPKAYEESNVADFTIAHEELEETEKKIRLKSGIDIRRLMNNEGIVLDPEIDDALDAEYDPNNPSNRDYFSNAATEENIQRIFAGVNQECGDNGDVKDDSDFDDGASEFEFRAKNMNNIIDDGGVKKKVLKHGLECTGSVPNRATITIHYSLYLEGQDEPYDSSILRGKCERYILDDGQLLPGLEIAIKSMKKNEQSEFLISSAYGFGEFGCPPRIPPKSDIRAHIELLDFVEEGQAQALLNMPPTERSKRHTFADVMKIVAKEHVEGNEYVKKREYKLAARKYVNACKLLEEVDLKDDKEEDAQKRLLKKLWLNRSYCYLKINHPKQACVVLQQTISEFPREAKALYRMGKAKKLLANYDESRRYFLKALALRPDDDDIGRELAMIDRQLKMEQDNERALCRRMFDNRANSMTNGRSYQSYNGSIAPTLSGREIEIDDDDYEEMVEQLEAFKLSSKKEMVLPPGLRKDDLRVAKIASENIGGLEFVEYHDSHSSEKRWKIVK